MEIIIRTDQIDGFAQPSAAAIAPPATVHEQAAAIGAIDAGPAPLPPGETGTPPTTISTSQHVSEPDVTSLSGGPAPELG